MLKIKQKGLTRYKAIPAGVSVRTCTIRSESRKGLGVCAFLEIYKVGALWNEEREIAELLQNHSGGEN